MLKKSNLKMYQAIRRMAVRKNRRSLIGRTLLPRSVVLNVLLAIYWIAFLGFAGNQIYHRQFLLYPSAMFLSPLVQLYTLLLVFNYFKSKKGLSLMAKAEFSRGIIEEINALADYTPGSSNIFRRIEIRLSSRETILTPSFSEKFLCGEGTVLYLFMKPDKSRALYGMAEPNTGMTVVFNKNFAVKNFIEAFGQSLLETKEDSLLLASQKIVHLHAMTRDA